MGDPVTGDRHERIMAEAERIKALGEASESVAPYAVNQATIGTWLDAMGYDNPRFRDGDEAPPSMAQVWTMPGLGRKRAPEDPLSRMTEFLTAQGYTAVLGTNCEQSYERYLRVGERPRVTSALDSVAGPKQTAMGEGWFVTSRNVWYVDHEDGSSEKVAEMLFRVLKFIPTRGAPPPVDPPNGEEVASLPAPSVPPDQARSARGPAGSADAERPS